MFWNFQELSEVYKVHYKEAKKKFEKSGELAPYAVIFPATNRDLGPLRVPIFDEDDESKSRSFYAMQSLAEFVGADCVLIVGEVWLTLFDLHNPTESKREEAIRFSFQSKDGSYHAHVPILRKGKKVRLPNSPPPLEPYEALAGRSKVF